jgi:hypothetical protein
MCKKEKFKYVYIAMKAIKRLRRKDWREKLPVRVYKCPHCGFYHLTSKELTKQI